MEVHQKDFILELKKRFMEPIQYTPIGVIHSPFTEVTGMPIQPAGAAGVCGTVVVAPAYCDGLKDLDGFSHLVLVYHFHKAKGYRLQVTPFLDNTPRGVFATRAPKRPNPVGISVVKLLKVEKCILYIEDVDILDGTPLIDIKPYVPAFDVRAVEKMGWLSEKMQNVYTKRADNRFISRSSAP